MLLRHASSPRASHRHRWRQRWVEAHPCSKWAGSSNPQPSTTRGHYCIKYSCTTKQLMGRIARRGEGKKTLLLRLQLGSDGQAAVGCNELHEAAHPTAA